MKAVILAAGEGKRLRPFTETMPKVMLPVANKPIIEYVIDALKNSGIQEIIVVVGYKKEAIMEHLKDYEDVQIKYVTQNKQLGTAHALLQAKGHIKTNDTFLLLSGDNIIDQKSILRLIDSKSEYSLLIKEHPHPSKFGIVLFEKDTLKKVVDHPKGKIGNLIPIGVYKFPYSVFNEVKKSTSKGEYSIYSVIRSIIEKGIKIKAVNADLWMEFVYPWDLIHVNEFMTHFTPSSINGVIEKDVTIKGHVLVGKDTTIYSGCYIVGPVVIGEGCEIGPNTCIFPSTTIGNNTVVQPFSEIRNSVILNDIHIGSNSFISHSIIGQGCSLGNNFSSMVGKAVKKIEDNYKELGNIGSMIGEDSIIDNHVVIDPGIIIGRKCNIKSMNRIIENLPSESKVM